MDSRVRNEGYTFGRLTSRPESKGGPFIFKMTEDPDECKRQYKKNYDRITTKILTAGATIYFLGGQLCNPLLQVKLSKKFWTCVTF
jgi:hypothetical protein